MKKLSNDDFIKRSNIIHNNLYNYDKTNYVNSRLKVIITCSIHGDFKQLPSVHLRGCGCPKCIGRMDKNHFIKRSSIIHNNFYNYDKVNYINIRTKVIIVCPIHGDFEQLPLVHLRGCGCSKCLDKVDNIEKFISKSNIIHNYFYNYDKSVYKLSKEKIIITCPIHGDFEQRPNDHLEGYGCPRCNESHGEKEIRKLLDLFKIKYESQKIFEDCIYKKILKFDFYLTDYNICIEYDGIQHFKSLNIFGGDKEYENIQIRDNIKNNYCEQNKIKLIRIKYNDDINFILKNNLFGLI